MRLPSPRETSVALSSDEAGRFAALLKGHGDELVGSWTDEVATTLRGRLSRPRREDATCSVQKPTNSSLCAFNSSAKRPASSELSATLSPQAR